MAACVFLPSVPLDAQERGSRAVLEEIVVVARRREESLQNVPLSVAALTADALEAEGIQSIEQLGELVPSLTLATGDRANHNFVFIRGIGGGGPDPVFPTGTGMYIDGHYIPNSVGGYMSTLDIDRVEVLRGPQGTLFGKNTTGGAINIISTKPGPELGSSLRLRLGQYGQEDIRGTLNFPVSENVFARLSAASEQSDGYYFNRHLDTDSDWTDHKTIMGALRLVPSNHWVLDSSLIYSEYRDGEKGGQCAPGPEPFARGRAAWWGDDENETETYAICDTDRSFGPFVNSSGKRVFSNVDTEAVFIGADWSSGGAVGVLEELGVKTTASYRKLEYEYLHDRDYMELPIFAIGTGATPRSTLTRSTEVLVEGRVNERLDFLTGVHYFFEETVMGDDRCYRVFLRRFDPADPGANILCEPFSGTIFERFPLRGIMSGNITGAYNTSLGLFGHLTYALNDRWSLEAGIRYTEDEREFFNFELDFANVELVDPTTLAHFDAIMNEEALFAFNEGTDTFSDVTPTISLTRKLEPGDRLDAGMFYLRYAEGFLTGGFNTELNLREIPELAPLQSYGPEHVDNYEVGFKGTFADGRLRFNTAVFYMDYADKQDDVIIDNSDGRFGNDPDLEQIFVEANVSEVVIYGLELELRARPWDGGSVSLDLGYLYNEYGEYDTLDDELNLVDRSRVRISDLSPDWTANLTIEHSFVLANGAYLMPMIGAYWQSEYEWLDGLDRNSLPSFCFEGDYAKWRARLTYEPASADYRVSVYANNINDELIYENCRTFRGIYTYRHAQPALWGIELSARWGD